MKRHTNSIGKAKHQPRGTTAERGYGYRWQKYTKVFLAEHPLCECEECKANGWITPAEVVDHIIPHKGNQELFWDPNNHQAMSAAHHNRKTAREDMGAWTAKR